MAVAMKNGRATMPAKKPVSTDTYSGRISARVRELRELRGYTVADLAKRLNGRLHKSRRIANSTLHGWDNGTRKVDPDYYPELAAALQVSIRQLFPE
jgi:transcriptional regulator with XRE-family HTH domain